MGKLIRRFSMIMVLIRLLCSIYRKWGILLMLWGLFGLVMIWCWLQGDGRLGRGRICRRRRIGRRLLILILNLSFWRRMDCKVMKKKWFFFKIRWLFRLLKWRNWTIFWILIWNISCISSLLDLLRQGSLHWWAICWERRLWKESIARIWLFLQEGRILSSFKRKLKGEWLLKGKRGFFHRKIKKNTLLHVLIISTILCRINKIVFKCLNFLDSF